MNNKYYLDSVKFEKNFGLLKNKRIALYGAGRLTRELIPYIKEFDIKLIVDSNIRLHGNVVGGIPIVGIKDIVDIDIIIINTSELYWPEIYRHLCRLKNVEIFFRNGLKATSEKEILMNEFKSKCDNDAQKMIVELVCKKMDAGEEISWRDWGYSVYGPVIWTFFNWLNECAKRDGVAQFLFLARDGYLLIDEYKQYLKYHGNCIDNLIYFPASRRMTCVATISNKEELHEVMKYSFKGTVEQLFKSRFDVEIDKGDIDSQTIISMPNDFSRVTNIVEKYEIKIKEEILNEKEEYEKYIKKLPILKGKIGIVDLGFYGTLPRAIDKILKENTIYTYYFNGDLTSEFIANNDKVELCFQTSNDLYAMDSCIREYQNQNEAVFTAPYGMMERIQNGEIITNMQNYDFSINEEINAGIKKFISDINENEKVDPIFVDKLFGVVNTCCLKRGLHELKYMDSWSGFNK